MERMVLAGCAAAGMIARQKETVREQQWSGRMADPVQEVKHHAMKSPRGLSTDGLIPGLRAGSGTAF
jgi:hypothetical protein